MFFKRKKLTEQEFSNRFAKALQKKVLGLEVMSIDKLEIKTKFENSSDFTHFLNNCYSEYLNAPKDINQIFQKYLNGAETLYLPDPPIDIERILPIIKDQRFIDDLKEINPDFELNHVYENYNSELFIFYAHDTEHTINYLTKEDLGTVDISFENLREKSISNLSETLSIEKHGDDGNFMLVAGGSYEASAILLDIWNKENFPVDGNIVIGIPSRDLLVITGSNDSKNLHKMFDLIENINQTGDHIVSNKLFEFKEGMFEVL